MKILQLHHNDIVSGNFLSIESKAVVCCAESSTSVMTNHCANLKAPLLMVRTLGSVDFQGRHCEVVSLRCIVF